MLIKNFLTISRANIQISSLPTALIGIVLAVQRVNELFVWSVFLYIILFFLILTFSCHVNCLHDVEVDRNYKTYMSDAVMRIGPDRLKKWIIIVAFGCSVIIMALCILKRNPLYLSAYGALACGFIYSAPPLRIKKRGFLSPLPVMAGLYGLPLVAGWFLIMNRLSGFIFFFALGYAFIMQGITFVNTCEDFEEDRECGIKTMAHVLGIRRTLMVGSVFVIGGGIITLVLIVSFRFPSIPMHPFLAAAVLTLSISFLGVILDIVVKMYRLSRSVDPVLSSKESARFMPLWFLSTRYCLLLLALLTIH